MEHNKELEQIRIQVKESYLDKKQHFINSLENGNVEHTLSWNTERLVFSEVLSNLVDVVISALLEKDSLEKQIEFCKIWRKNSTRDLMSALQSTSTNSNEMHNIVQRIRFSVRGSFLASGEHSLTHIENILEKALQEKQKGVL